MKADYTLNFVEILFVKSSDYQAEWLLQIIFDEKAIA
jgi:hypothetical protein